MSEAKSDESELNALLCGCGRRLRYSHSGQRMSCNKYAVCLTYDEQSERIRELSNDILRYKNYLQKIVDVNGMDYEYKAWAKECLDT